MSGDLDSMDLAAAAAAEEEKSGPELDQSEL